MSTSSAQTDRLRERAKVLRQGRWCDGPDDAQVMEDAADTICELQAENAKLAAQLEDEKAENGWAREFLNRIGPKCGTKDCPSLVAYVGKLEDENARLRSCLSDDVDNARQIMGENAKLRDQLEEQKCFAADLERDVRALRELVRDMCEWAYVDSDCDLEDRFTDRMRELGIEVD